jgi:hypothetical protein
MENKHCKTCYTEIAVKAKKCTHCDSFQNWRKNLILSSNILVLVIALLSISGLVIPLIKAAFEADISNVKVRSYVITEDGISLLCVNSDNKPGYISNCKIEIKDRSTGRVFRDFNLDLRYPSNSRVVNKKDLEEKYYSIKTDFFMKEIDKFSNSFKDSLSDTNFVFYVNVNIVQYDGSKEKISLGPSCVKHLYDNL